MNKRLSSIIALGAVVTATAAFGAIREGEFSLSPVIGGYTYDGKQHLETSLAYGGRAGYAFTKNFGVEGLFDFVNTEATAHGTLGDDVNMYRYGGDLLYHFMPDNNLVPFLAAGFAGLNFDKDGLRKTKGAFDYGAGIKYFLTDRFALRGDVRHIIYKYDKTYNNLEYTVGAYIPFGGTKPVVKPVAVPAPVVAPVPAPVVEVPKPAAPKPADADGDGIVDSLDKCAATPAGVAVDKVGCPLDTDKDGVFDYQDKCPGTPAGVAVDKVGCPLDSDKDGVLDYQDKCPGTPAGVAVDKVGCPLDSDKDGVLDYQDKCPGTPIGVAVDKDGCPLDSDKDAVLDNQDKCPGTPAGVKVDAEGCPIKLCSPTVINVQFDTNKADIKPQFHDELKKLADFLKEFPKAKGEIAGHTDSDGAKAANMKLSQRRADSVRNYLVSKFGIAGDRITAKGYGPTKPVADNKTAAGKAQNRRIEANFTCD